MSSRSRRARWITPDEAPLGDERGASRRPSRYLRVRPNYFERVPNWVVTVANGPVILISYVADASASDFVARL